MARAAGRAAQGAGSLRKRAAGGWEARYTVGRDPGTGKQIQRSVYGKTQAETRKKLAAAVAALDSGTYFEPCKATLGSWLDTWLETYVRDSVKPYTYRTYQLQVNNHLKPALGAVPLVSLTAPAIQSLYAALLHGTAKHQQAPARREGHKEKPKPLSPKTIKNIHGVLHKALQKAVELRYIPFNPADACTLPRMQKADIKPLEEAQIAALWKAMEDEPYKNLFLVTLFTGMREGEVLGLGWGNVDLAAGIINITRQLQREKVKNGAYYLETPKNGKGRTIKPAPFVMELLRDERRRQTEARLRAGSGWQNKWDLVFTDPLGGHLALHTVYKHFKKLVVEIGAPDTRFHDLRHTYAVTALQAGDDIKTVQGNLGHATASFTLDVYGHVTEQMKQASADRMQQTIERLQKA